MTDRLRFTEEMAKAGTLLSLDLGIRGLTRTDLESLFRAMLAAAPQEEYQREFNRLYQRRLLMGIQMRPNKDSE